MIQPERVLARVPMFACAPARDLVSFARRGRIHAYRAGTIVFVHGDPADKVFCVMEGRIQIVTSMAGGKTQLHTVLGPGDLFGELGVLGEMPRSATAECLEDSAVWGVSGEELLQFLDRHPSVARGLIAALARQIDAQDAVVEDLLYLDLKGRLAKRLLGLASISGVTLEPGPLLPVTLTQSQLASLAGGSREKVSRILSEFRRRGFIERSGGQYILKDVDALRHLAGV